MLSPPSLKVGPPRHHRPSHPTYPTHKRGLVEEGGVGSGRSEAEERGSPKVMSDHHPPLPRGETASTIRFESREGVVLRATGTQAA